MKTERFTLGLFDTLTLNARGETIVELSPCEFLRNFANIHVGKMGRTEPLFAGERGIYLISAYPISIGSIVRKAQRFLAEFKYEKQVRVCEREFSLTSQDNKVNYQLNRTKELVE